MAKTNQKYLIIVIALVLAAVGYYGYRSLMVKPDINVISVPRTLPSPNLKQKAPNPKVVVPPAYK